MRLVLVSSLLLFGACAVQGSSSSGPADPGGSAVGTPGVASTNATFTPLPGPVQPSPSPSPPPAPPAPSSAPLGHGSDVALADDTLFVVDPTGIRVFDVSTPSAPANVSYLPMTSGAYEVKAIGSLVATLSSDGFRLFDASDRGALSESAFVATSVPPRSLSMDATHAVFVAERDTQSIPNTSVLHSVDLATHIDAATGRGSLKGDVARHAGTTYRWKWLPFLGVAPVLLYGVATDSGPLTDPMTNTQQTSLAVGDTTLLTIGAELTTHDPTTGAAGRLDGSPGHDYGWHWFPGPVGERRQAVVAEPVALVASSVGLSVFRTLGGGDLARGGDLPSATGRAASDGTYAYVVDGTHLVVADLSDPNAPSALATITW